MKVPSPLLSEVCTPSFPNPTISAFPSPLISAIIRGCLSVLHPPFIYPKVLRTRESAVKVPSPLLREVNTPLSPNPTISAFPSPLISAIIRGCLSVLHPPLSYPYALSTSLAAVKVPSPLLREVNTPALANPTISAFPSPLISAIIRGCLSTLHPPLPYPYALSTRLESVKVCLETVTCTFWGKVGGGVGYFVGSGVGFGVGYFVGSGVGSGVGDGVGSGVGGGDGGLVSFDFVGIFVGTNDGKEVGFVLGTIEGDAVGVKLGTAEGAWLVVAVSS